ncbi:thermonuclease family protein [uncultured Desulfovibrio sp.]|uniref:thermonuclease family protein n=1 Tax=uncultured Desulfovibrio sp. TaxID=167968 RepID=UPI00262F0250|nr:thermonuclease family protein [uncultured Desulfovibrio sp.]
MCAVMRSLPLLLMLCLLAAEPVQAFVAYVRNVEDSDCISVTRSRSGKGEAEVYCFYGISAPRGRQPMAVDAKALVRRMLKPGTRVTVQSPLKDDKGRQRALIYVDGISMSSSLLEAGLAWVDRKNCKAMFCPRWYRTEQEAAAGHKGIWGLGLNSMPWQWQEE